MNLKYLNGLFDHVYVLTLEGSKDRQYYFEENFNRLEFEFFFGMDRRNINFDNIDWTGTPEICVLLG